jgi:hypothetical protein
LTAIAIHKLYGSNRHARHITIGALPTPAYHTTSHYLSTCSIVALGEGSVRNRLGQAASEPPISTSERAQNRSARRALRLRRGQRGSSGYRNRSRRRSTHRLAASLRRSHRRLARGRGAAARTSPRRTLRAPRRSRGVRHARLRRRADGDSRVSRAALALDNHVHVQLGAELEACSGPGAEVVTCVDGAADVHTGADGPELLEVGVIAFDGRGVGALLLPDFVGATVGLKAPVLG